MPMINTRENAMKSPPSFNNIYYHIISQIAIRIQIKQKIYLGKNHLI